MNILVDPTLHPVIAHRGDSANHPENTIVSFDSAVSLGADALELDVRVTRDDVPVVIHDALVDRTTNGVGTVASLTLAELRELDAGARFAPKAEAATAGNPDRPFRGRGVRVPTIDDVLARYPSIPIIIEVKEREAVEPLQRAIRRNNAEARVLIDAANQESVAPFRGGASHTGASLSEAVRLLLRSALPFPCGQLPFNALCIPRSYLGLRIPVGHLARFARRAGVVTHVWTINEPGLAAGLWRAGINGIITDDPALMLRVRADPEL